MLKESGPTPRWGDGDSQSTATPLARQQSESSQDWERMDGGVVRPETREGEERLGPLGRALWGWREAGWGCRAREGAAWRGGPDRE